MPDYRIQKWYVSSKKGPIPESGCKEGYRLTIEQQQGGGYHVTWQDSERQDPQSFMSPPSMHSQGVQVHFGGADPIPCTVDLEPYGDLLMGAFTCGSGPLGVSDGNAGIFVAEATIGPGDPA